MNDNEVSEIFKNISKQHSVGIANPDEKKEREYVKQGNEITQLPIYYNHQLFTKREDYSFKI